MIKFKDINYPRRLVAKAFIDNPNNLNEINHKDEDKSNIYKGFIWRFIDDNDYSIKCKSKIIKIYNGTETIYNSVSEAAIKNNISVSAIYNCLYGKSKTCGGYEWIKR